MAFLLDLSGYDDAGKPGIKCFGGLYPTIESAEKQGRSAAKTGRFVFKPSKLWVRDEENTVVRYTEI